MVCQLPLPILVSVRHPQHRELRQCEESTLTNHQEKTKQNKKINSASYLTLSSPFHRETDLPPIPQIVLHHTVIMSQGWWPAIYSQDFTISNLIQAVLLGLQLQILIPQKVMIATQFRRHLLSPYIITCVKPSNRALAGPRQAPGLFYEQVTNLQHKEEPANSV